MKFKTSNNIYAHIDCDSFFASCEILRDSSLQGKYVCVGEEIIVAATYNVKALGVKVGMPIWEAKKKLKGKDAYFLGHHMEFYADISRKLMSYLRKNVLDVRVFSIDEAFVDISGLPEMHNMDLYDYLLELQNDILSTVGIPVSIGVSNTRLKAKIFSKVNKPFGVCVGIDTQIEKELFENLSFREIPFIGTQTAKKLDFHISSLQDYIDIGYFEIIRRFGKNGGKIWLELRGVSSMGFLPKREAKSIGRARCFNKEMTGDPKILLEKISANLDRMFEALIHKHYEIRHISLLLIHKSWEKKKTHFHFECYTHDRKQIYQQLEKMFYDIYIPGEIYRKTGVFSHDIQSFDTKQLSLFEKENINFSKTTQLESIVSDMKQVYGSDIIKIGV